MSDAKIRPRTELDKMKKIKFKSNFEHFDASELYASQRTSNFDDL